MHAAAETRHSATSTAAKETRVRKIPWCSRPQGFFGVILIVLMMGVGLAAAAEPKKFTLINVLLDGTKIWLPSSVMVQRGDAVELTLINKLDEPHGFKVEAFGIEEVVQPKAQTTVKFTASKTGAHSYICQMHPPHLGGNILVLSK